METRYLFRGKRIDNGEWEIGSLIALPDGKFEIANKCENPPDGDPMWRKCVITHYVDPSTICQCTGLTDRHGKLIFEKDILSGLELVLWLENGWYKEPKNDNPYELEEYDCEEDTVIGNKFDNPELLEV